MKFDPSVASFILAFGCSVSGWFVWWINKIDHDKQAAAQNAKKDYAQQRDFEHLRNNQKQIGDGLAHGFKDMEERFDIVDRELLRIEAYLIQGKRTTERD
jgi:hypothetical protein